MLSMPLAECLRRIKERDASVQAFSEVNPQQPLAPGPLSDVPFGVKDIFDTAGIRTSWGTPLLKDRVPAQDAALVALFRRRGAVMVGKTHTTSFAYFDAAPTRNPHNSAHTPGGSSSGSAAAVAAGMVPVALGTQTQGSVLRPASYCGCVGFKPTYGRLPIEGCMPFAPTLDTMGLFTATAAGMQDLWTRLIDAPGAAFSSAPNIAVLAMPDEVEPPMRASVRAAAERLGAKHVEPPESFRQLHVTVRLLQQYEGARTHESSWRRHGAAVGAKLAQLIEAGLAMSEAEYRDLRRKLVDARRDMMAILSEYPIVITPAALGPAPATLTTTGDPRMNAPWTGLGAPAISLPMPVEPGALPLGLQIAAAPSRDSQLLAAAVAIEQALR